MCKVLGYARISRKTQNIERQIRNIRNYCPDCKIYEEAYTGRQISRPKFNQLLKDAKPGDTIVFDSVSRMSRNAAEGIDLYFSLYNKGINLVFLKEGHISTDSYSKALQAAGMKFDLRNETAEETLVSDIIKAVNKFMIAKVQDDIAEAFRQSEKEVEDLRQRTKEGLQTAKEHGQRVGTPKGTSFVTKKSVEAKAVIMKHSRDFNGTLNDADCMKLAECSRNSYYKFKKELKTDMLEAQLREAERKAEQLKVLKATAD